jgi:hypothetical protein
MAAYLPACSAVLCASRDVGTSSSSCSSPRVHPPPSICCTVSGLPNTNALSYHCTCAGRVMLKTKGAGNPNGRDNVPGANTLPAGSDSGDADDSEDDTGRH